MQCAAAPAAADDDDDDDDVCVWGGGGGCVLVCGCVEALLVPSVQLCERAPFSPPVRPRLQLAETVAPQPGQALKESVADMKRREAQNERLMFEIAAENRRLAEPLARSAKEVETLRAELAARDRERASLAAAAARLAAADKRVRGGREGAGQGGPALFVPGGLRGSKCACVCKVVCGPRTSRVVSQHHLLSTLGKNDPSPHQNRPRCSSGRTRCCSSASRALSASATASRPAPRRARSRRSARRVRAYAGRLALRPLLVASASPCLPLAHKLTPDLPETPI